MTVRVVKAKWHGLPLIVLTLVLVAEFGGNYAIANLKEKNVLESFVCKEDPHFSWFDTKHTIEGFPLGGTGFILNVTSLKWMNEYYARGPNGALWTHQVVVVIPRDLEVKNVSFAYLTGGCNENPHLPTAFDEEIILADTIAYASKAPVIVVKQIPNCPIVYPDDQSQLRRSEDAMIAFSWLQYMNKSSEYFGDHRLLPRLPMTKAAFSAMKAAQEWMALRNFAKINAWVVSGASKRGWTSWMVGTVRFCPNLQVKVVGICPLVPIVPNLHQALHFQWQSYNGWTFAFNDYYQINLTEDLDSREFKQALQIVDPINYMNKLKDLPTLVTVSSDDEFMQMDWSQLWYDRFSKGDTRLLIAPNSEHSLVTAIPEVVENIGSFFSTLVHVETRPSFSYNFNKSSGLLSVTIPYRYVYEGLKVTLRYAFSHSSYRRDFRWVRLSNNFTGRCEWPDIPLKKPIDGGNCLQPIPWFERRLNPVSSAKFANWDLSSFRKLVTSDSGDLLADGLTFRANPPKNMRKKSWTGYFIEIKYLVQGRKKTLRYTTPGFTWPLPFPFADCDGKSCRGYLV